MTSLLELSLQTLIETYSQELENIETNGVQNGIILTNASDVILKLKGDLRLFWINYKTSQYDELFDLILDTHISLVMLDEIIGE